MVFPALFSSCLKRNESITKYLIEHGANVNATWDSINYSDVRYSTSLAVSCYYRCTTLVKFLIDHGANVNLTYVDPEHHYPTPLCTACKNNNESIIKYLVEHSADTNAEYNISDCTRDICCCYEGATPLINAIEYNIDESIVSYLIEHCANVNNLHCPYGSYYYMEYQYTPLS